MRIKVLSPSALLHILMRKIRKSRYFSQEEQMAKLLNQEVQKTSDGIPYFSQMDLIRHMLNWEQKKKIRYLIELKQRVLLLNIIKRK